MNKPLYNPEQVAFDLPLSQGRPISYDAGDWPL